jgi:hypothetical protein
MVRIVQRLILFRRVIISEIWDAKGGGLVPRTRERGLGTRGLMVALDCGNCNDFAAQRWAT